MDLWFLASLVLVVACSDVETTDGLGDAPAPASGTVRIADVAVDTTGPEVLVRVRVENGTNAPVFTMTSPRRVVYRGDAKTLELTLVEEVATPNGSSADCHYMAPAQKELGALRAGTIEMRLPRIQKQLLAQANPIVVDEPLYESKQVDVSLAWSDVPLRPDRDVTSKCAVEISQNVVAKQRGVTTGTWKSP